MIDGRRRLAWLCSIVLVGVIVCTTGCSKVFGPEHMRVTRVTGVVKIRRDPVKSGWIEFIPIENTVGKLCSAKIQKDGTFEATHVAVGLNLIRLAHAPLGASGAQKLFGSYHSSIRRVVRENSAEPIFIDVVDELMRYERQINGVESKPRVTGEER